MGGGKMNAFDKLFAEANEAFYEWEEENGVTGLSDDARIMWCYGYITHQENTGD